MDGTSFGMGISTCSGSLLAIEKCLAEQIGLVHGCGPRERSPLLLHDERLGATSDRADGGIDFSRQFHMGEVRCATRRIHGAAKALLRPAEAIFRKANLDRNFDIEKGGAQTSHWGYCSGFTSSASFFSMDFDDATVTTRKSTVNELEELLNADGDSLQAWIQVTPVHANWIVRCQISGTDHFVVNA